MMTNRSTAAGKPPCSAGPGKPRTFPFSPCWIGSSVYVAAPGWTSSASGYNLFTNIEPSERKQNANIAAPRKSVSPQKCPWKRVFISFDPAARPAGGRLPSATINRKFTRWNYETHSSVILVDAPRKRPGHTRCTEARGCSVQEPQTAWRTARGRSSTSYDSAGKGGASARPGRGAAPPKRAAGPPQDQ